MHFFPSIEQKKLKEMSKDDHLNWVQVEKLSRFFMLLGTFEGETREIWDFNRFLEIFKRENFS